MNIAIIGYGVVGKATHHSVLNNDSRVDVYDIDREYSVENPSYDLVFICVPTSNAEDLSLLKRLCLDILENHGQTCICIRSTVPVGFVSRDLRCHGNRVWYFPEFLRERHWLKDSLNATWVIGCLDQIPPLLDKIFRSNPRIVVTPAEAEILKLMSNTYSAMHVVFANHIYDLSEKMQASYDVIQDCHDLIKHKDQTYLQVSPELRGFGGKCLPKDLDCLISNFEKSKITQTLFNSIRDDNKKWPITVREDQ
jgi:UDPglucose 6-dehydrogenase